MSLLLAGHFPNLPQTPRAAPPPASKVEPTPPPPTPPAEPAPPAPERTVQEIRRSIFEHVRDGVAATGQAPTFRELETAIGLKRGRALEHVYWLERRGYLRAAHGSWRSLVVAREYVDE